MFLANKGMTALLMCPMRSALAVSGVARTAYVVSYIYEGPMLTQQEAETLRGQLNYTTTGMTQVSRLPDLFNQIRKRLGYTTDTPPATRSDPLSRKAYGRNVDEVCFRMRPPSASKLTALVAGTVGLLITVTYEGDGPNTNTTGLIVVMSVGLPGSGAEVEIENTAVSIGDILRINDLYIKIDGLLGET